jgi:hypothetical protein
MKITYDVFQHLSTFRIVAYARPGHYGNISFENAAPGGNQRSLPI